MRIAGKLTISEWATLRGRLKRNRGNWQDPPEDRELVIKFFKNRVHTRFLGPISVVQRAGKQSGEGFAIVAMQCMLIEFLETLRSGLIFNSSGKPNRKYEYNRTKVIFVSFLSNRFPFAHYFRKNTALDFYYQFRCPLIHEGGTRGKSKILAESGDNRLFEMNGSVMTIFRNDFKAAIDQYCQQYQKELLTNRRLQDSFIRKYDHIALVD